MGLNTFPLLQDRTDLFTYKNSVFKLKLEYQNVSQEMKEAFIQLVPERAAHCQIEDVCRAVLYNIEREQPVSAIQSEHFLIYPEIHRWPLADKVQFFIHKKQLTCHQDLILLKIFCKTDVVSAHDRNQLKTAELSGDTSQVKSRSETSSKTNSSTPCPGYTTKKTSSLVMSGPQTSGPLCGAPAAGLSSILESVGPDSSNTVTTVPQQQSSTVSSHTATEEQSCHLEVNRLKTSSTTEAVVDGLSDKSRHKKPMEPRLRRKDDHNVSRKTKCPVNVTKKDNTSQYTQQSPELVHRRQTVMLAENPQDKVQHTHDKTEHFYTSDLHAKEGVQVSQTPGSSSSVKNGQTTSSQHEIVSKRNQQVMATITTRSQLRKRSVCNELSEGLRKGKRHEASRKKTRVTSAASHQSVVKGLKNVTDSKGFITDNRSVDTCDTGKGNMKFKNTSDGMTLQSSFEISDKNVVELSCDGRTLYESEKLVNARGAPVSPYVTPRNRNRRQFTSSINTHDTNQYQVCRCQSTEKIITRKLAAQVNSSNIANERRQCQENGTSPVKRAKGDSSQFSIRGQRIATKINSSREESASQYNCSIISKKKLSSDGKEKVINEELTGTTKNREKYSFDSLQRTATSHSDSSVSGETDTTSRSLRSKKKALSLSPEVSRNRGNRVPDDVVKAQQHLLKAKDGVWLWKS